MTEKEYAEATVTIKISDLETPMAFIVHCLINNPELRQDKVLVESCLALSAAVYRRMMDLDDGLSDMEIHALVDGSVN